MRIIHNRSVISTVVYNTISSRYWRCYTQHIMSSSMKGKVTHCLERVYFLHSQLDTKYFCLKTKIFNLLGKINVILSSVNLGSYHRYNRTKSSFVTLCVGIFVYPGLKLFRVPLFPSWEPCSLFESTAKYLQCCL